MTRKLRRTPSYELALTLKDDGFLRTPRPGQRAWFLNRLLKETSDELEHLHKVAPDLVAGADDAIVAEDRSQAILGDDEIMENWQATIMDRMAEIVTRRQGDVLEIGFGRGIGSGFIQKRVPRSHTLIECNDEIVRRCQAWRAQQPGADIRIEHGLWQDRLPGLGQFDGIFFHTYPLNDAEFVEFVAKSSTFAEHFFIHAARHLRPGGVFTYLTMEADSIGRGHQRALLRNFGRVSLSMIEDLGVPPDTRDAHWFDRMILVDAEK